MQDALPQAVQSWLHVDRCVEMQCILQSRPTIAAITPARMSVGVVKHDVMERGSRPAHSMGVTLASMKAISAASRPYLAYSWASISGMDVDQSMSDPEVKSWAGTYFQVLRGLC